MRLTGLCSLFSLWNDLMECHLPILILDKGHKNLKHCKEMYIRRSHQHTKNMHTYYCIV